MPKPTIVGGWEKTSSARCDQRYPDRLQFQENGLYIGQKDPPGSFSFWDVGTFEVVDEQEIKLSTANDAVIAYAYALSADTLTFTDPDGCAFSYRRAP